MLRIEWDEPSKRWIERMPRQFAAGLAKATKIAMRRGAGVALQHAKNAAPRFEGWLAEDLKVYPLNVIDAEHFKILIGESGALLISGEPVQKYDPFSYAFAKEYGAEPHRVWLYGKGGQDTQARKKLRRWFRQNVHSDLPKTEEEFRRKRPPYPPFITVHPTAEPFLHTSEIFDVIYEIFEGWLQEEAPTYWKNPW